MNDEFTVVTGATGGIGRAIVARLRARGAAVLATGREAERLAACFGADPGVTCVACDPAAEDSVETLKTAIRARNAVVRGFVHAAGFDAFAPLGLTTPDVAQRLFAVHAGFPLRFLGWLARRESHAKEGTAAVLISSLAAHEGAAGHAAYAAAKGAVEGLLRPAAAELVAKGVRLNAVVPGVVETPMSAEWTNRLDEAGRERLRRRYPLGFGRPDDVAAAVDFLLSSDARWITGQTLVCDGGHGLT